MLGHGAGGAPYSGGASYSDAGGAPHARDPGRFEPDLLAARDAALAVGLDVLLVEQPWRVAGRRVAEAPARLDEAWLGVMAQLPTDVVTVVGGRSAGARVACRTSGRTGATGVLCLAFPLQPQRPGSPSREPELALPEVPVLVVQGGRDAFGLPEARPGRTVTVVPGGNHAFVVRRSEQDEALADVGRAVRGWLDLLPGLVRR